jgi:hypothetical protein
MYWITNILDGIGWRGLLCLASLHGLHLQICPNSTNVVVTPSDKQVWMNEVYNIIYIYICVCGCLGSSMYVYKPKSLIIRDPDLGVDM